MTRHACRSSYTVLELKNWSAVNGLSNSSIFSEEATILIAPISPTAIQFMLLCCPKRVTLKRQNKKYWSPKKL